MADRRLSDVELERVLAGERDLAPTATAADRARLDALRTEHAAFLAGVDVAAEVRAIRARAHGDEAAPAEAPARARWRWLWLAASGAVAAAAALVLVFGVGLGSRPRPTERAGTAGHDDVETKGAAVALVIHTSTGGPQSRVLQSGDAVTGGTRIRFEVQAARRGFVTVIGVDDDGTATVYYPFGGVAPSAYDPRARVLPGAVVLDETPGSERFCAVYGEQPFSLEAAVAALRSRRALPAGVGSAEVVLRKAPR